jgi:hypothetical protein
MRNALLWHVASWGDREFPKPTNLQGDLKVPISSQITFNISVIGNFETCPTIQRMSVHRGGSEVAAAWLTDVKDLKRTWALSLLLT